MRRKINADKPHLWKADVAASVDQFNQWFMEFAPRAFRSTRVTTTERVKAALVATRDLRHLDAATLRANPGTLPTLRMCTAPPLAVDRLVGLASASKSLIGSMEEGKLAARMKVELLDENLGKVCRVLSKLLDHDIFPWLDAGKEPTDHERDRASTIVADRLCSAVAKDTVRSARRSRHHSVLAVVLDSLGYREALQLRDADMSNNEPGTYAIAVSLPFAMGEDAILPVSVHVRPHSRQVSWKSFLLDVGAAQDVREASSDVARFIRKRRAVEMTYGDSVRYAVMLGGFYHAGTLGMLAAEGIDWIWQHRAGELVDMIHTQDPSSQNLTLQLG